MASASPLLPDTFANWFAARGWEARSHQLEMVARAQAGRDALLIAPTGGGKTEAYHVLATREGLPGEPTGYIYAGFQRPPTRAQLRDYIVTQDLAAIEACFDRIPVRPGDTFLIPGGTPHALGAGVFMVEIQEPSDLVVRFEFSRAGHVLPEASRFMGRDLDLSLRVFNLAPLGPAELADRVRCAPRLRRDLGAGSVQEELIGPDRTDCFQVRRTLLQSPVVKQEEAAVIAIVTAGTVLAEAGGETHRLETFAKCFLPAGLGPVRLTPVGGPAAILECLPPA